MKCRRLWFQRRMVHIWLQPLQHSWQLVSASAIETEYTLAFRREARYSMEYKNAYLYLQRIGYQWWLQKFEKLEEWLDKRPGEFLSLPIYPSIHAKSAEEKGLGNFVRQWSRS